MGQLSDWGGSEAGARAHPCAVFSGSGCVLGGGDLSQGSQGSGPVGFLEHLRSCLGNTREGRRAESSCLPPPRAELGPRTPTQSPCAGWGTGADRPKAGEMPLGSSSLLGCINSGSVSSGAMGRGGGCHPLGGTQWQALLDKASPVSLWAYSACSQPAWSGRSPLRV